MIRQIMLMLLCLLEIHQTGNHTLSDGIGTQLSIDTHKNFPTQEEIVSGTGWRYCAVCSEGDAQLVRLDERDFIIQSSHTLGWRGLEKVPLVCRQAAISYKKF